MKRLIVYTLLVVAVWLVPVERADVGKLHPVEIVMISKEGDGIKLSTDTQDVGVGANALLALEDMHQTSGGIVYLDTARFMVVGQGTEAEAERLRGVLKKGTKLCLVSNTVDLQAVTAYLNTHDDLPKLRDWSTGVALPQLHCINGRFVLENVQKTNSAQ